MVQKEVRRDPALDAVRALAIVMVLVIHTAAPALSSFTPGAPDWWGALAWGRRPGLRCRCSSCAPVR